MKKLFVIVILTYSLFCQNNAFCQNYMVVSQSGNKQIWIPSESIDSVFFEGYDNDEIPNPNRILSPEYLSSIESSTSPTYYDIVVDGPNLYALGNNGLQKIDISNIENPTLLASNILDAGTKKRSLKTGLINRDVLYVGSRNITGWLYEYLRPEMRFRFDSFIEKFDHYDDGVNITDNDEVNKFFQYLRINSKDQTLLTNAWLYKAVYKNGQYRNAILLNNEDYTYNLSFYGKYYNTEQEALNALGEIYYTQKGDTCVVDWNSIPLGANSYKNIKFKEKGVSGISDNSIVNSFFRQLTLASNSAEYINHAYIYKALEQSGGYKNAILLTDGKSINISFVSALYKTKQEALSELKNEYYLENGDRCIVDWNAINSEKNIFNGIKFSTTGEFDKYIQSGMVHLSQNGIPCPNTGTNSLLMQSRGKGNAMLCKQISNDGNELNISFWINGQVINEDIEIPMLGSGNNIISSLRLKPSNSNKFCIGLQTKNSNVSYIGFEFDKNEWYNIKIIMEDGWTTIFYRDKNCSNWNKGLTTTIIEKNAIEYILIGLCNTSTNNSILIDDFYYNKTNLDECSYINGSLKIIDKENLDVLSSFNYDNKVTFMNIYKDRLIVCFLNGFNVYDVSDSRNPILAFSYRHPVFKEFQGCGFYEKEGKVYCTICNYVDGITIVDITDPYNSKIVVEESSTYFTSNSRYNFDCVVDYPYIFTTYSVEKNVVGTVNDKRGCLVYDISDLNDIRTSLVEIPKDETSTCIDDGDIRPNRIKKYGNRIIMNNGNKGIATFRLNDGLPEFESVISITPNTSVNAISFDKIGNLYIGGMKTKSCPYSGIFIYKGF